MVWSDKLKKNQESYQNVHWSQRWNDDQSAIRFNKHVIGMRNHSQNLVDGLLINPNYHILEIGPGTGPLTIPLSSRVEHITAIEPSPYMIKVLKENLDEHHIQDVSIIQKRWEDIDPQLDLYGPYDLVLASHSLGMDNLKAAIQKMDDVSSGYVCLFWFFNSSFLKSAYITLWPSLHGKEYNPLPKSDVIYQILLQMGIHPEFKPYVTENQYRYSSIEEAISDFSINFGFFNRSPPHILEEFIRENSFTKNDDVHIAGTSMNAKIWWHKN
ncbi:MAG TPA: methyltransferase domain-containing protein [Methanospirillum sp.]|nr:methyltransferase domain-containing protein [Methanospirillum sp.]